MTARRKDLALLGNAVSLMRSAEAALSDYARAAASAFGEWIRSNPRLDSCAAGLSVQDADWIIHQYRPPRDCENRTRGTHCLLLLEEKRYGARPSFAQCDTLSILHQLIRPNARGRDADGRGRNRGWRLVRTERGEVVTVRYLGVYVLAFSGSGPLDSDEIRLFRIGDQVGKRIDLETLEGILRFDVDPATLQPIDYRSHHSPQPSMFESE